MTELAFGAAVCAAAALALTVGRKPWAALAVAAAGAVALSALSAGNRSGLEPPLGASLFDRTAAYATSSSCVPCHPAEYRSWRASYHRTMTQAVRPETVIGDFEDLTLVFDGRPYELYESAGKFWVELSDPDQVDQALALAQSGDFAAAQELARTIPRVQRQLVLSTGSHHYQLYWYRSGRGDELYMLPFAYLKQERRWAPRVSVFLTPPGQLEPRKVWNRDCLPCHSTGGAAGFEAGGGGAPETRLAETGIACEACHGPSLDHAQANRSPLRRYGLHLSGDADETTTHPLRLEHRRGSQVCGQCHSLNTQYNGEDWAATFASGLRFRPGDDLFETRYVVQPDTLTQSPLMEDFVRRRPAMLDEWFWSDGEIRVVGREYNGLLQSPCYASEDFGCLSCHSIHESDPDDQLRQGMRGDAACLQCHAEYEAKIAEHSHHPVDSSGARCQNCHMPHTSYGLLKASRSHTITSPSVQVELATRRPNACNLCHLDQPLSWTAEKLAAWYDIPAPGTDDGQGPTPAGASWMLRGDAGIRAIAAWHAGRPEAQQASPGMSLQQVLTPLLDDPYDAVRFVAARSLRTLPGLADVDYDFLDPPSQRRAAAGSIAVSGTERLLDADLIERLLRQRDDRPVYLVE